MMKVLLIIFLLILNIPICKYLFNLFFYDFFDFKKCLRYIATYDFISLSRGKYLKDQWYETKVLFYFFFYSATIDIE